MRSAGSQMQMSVRGKRGGVGERMVDPGLVEDARRATSRCHICATSVDRRLCLKRDKMLANVHIS